MTTELLKLNLFVRADQHEDIKRGGLGGIPFSLCKTVTVAPLFINTRAATHFSTSVLVTTPTISCWLRSLYSKQEIKCYCVNVPTSLWKLRHFEETKPSPFQALWISGAERLRLLLSDVVMEPHYFLGVTQLRFLFSSSNFVISGGRRSIFTI